MMFQTSAHNSWLIDQLAAAAPFPYATSAAETVYKRMPNDTDLTVFLDAGMAGMNFAADGGITRYHTALDNADMLDQRTLQHQGSYALSMARQFGSIDLNVPQSASAIFFVVVGKLIHYSARLAIPLRDSGDHLLFLRALDRNPRRTIQRRRNRRRLRHLRDRDRSCGRRSARSVVADDGARGLANAAGSYDLRRLLLFGRGGRSDFRHVVDGVRADWPPLSSAKPGRGRACGLDGHDARHQPFDARRQLYFHVAATVRDACDELSPASDQHPLRESRIKRIGAGNSHARAITRCKRGRNNAFSRVWWADRRSAFRLVHPLHRFSHQRTPMDRARRAWSARDHHDHQRQRGQ